MIDIISQRQQRIALASAQQQKASDPTSSVWVEASAGTGKTKVLTDRVLRLLLNDANPARILCLTYTKAAASEMNNRIIDCLAKWAVIPEAELIKQLQNLQASPDLCDKARRLFALVLDTPGGIKIQTIHSFCQEILKRFPLEAKISPYFEVMDDRETGETLSQISQDILSHQTPQVSSALNYITQNCSEFSFPQIMSSITDNCDMLENYFASYPDNNLIAEHIAQILNLSPETNVSTIKQQFWDNFASENIAVLLQALDAGSEKSKETAKLLSQAVNEQNFDNYTDIMLTKDGEPQKKFLIKKSQELFPQALQIYNDETARLIHHIQLIHTANLRDSTIAVLTIAREILNRYRQAKFNHCKMDYNDLINKTSQLLNSSHTADWVLYKLDGGLDHILIDEAQDTSPQQWSIIQALTKEFFSGYGSKSQKPTIFVVGDRKQSIYSFQGADVTEFEKMHNYFAATAQNFQTINMEVSFRSTAAILDMVNTVFTTTSAAKGVISPNQNIHHIPSRIGDCGHVELWGLTYPYSDSTADDIWLPPVERITAQSSSALLAQKIAEMIHHKVSSHELKADGTPLRYRDFLILIQRRNSFAEEMVRACKNLNVDIAGIDKINLNEQIVILDLLAAARFAILPNDDLNLCCLLKSPLFGLNDTDLFTLCYNRGDNSVWQQLQQSHVYTNIAKQLNHLYNISSQNRPFEFFSYILNNMQGRRKFIARLSSECEDAIDEFINQTLSFEQECIPTLQNFVYWMQSDDISVKRNLEQNNLDAVRLMTVHGSKGLQAPVVILPDTVRFKNIKQEAGWLKSDNELLYPLGKDFYNENCIKMQAISQNATIDEYNRLLYVALTRAGEQLYICGYTNKNAPNENSWYEICRNSLSHLAVKDDKDNLVYHQNSFTNNLAVPPSSPSLQLPELPHWLYQKPQTETPLSIPLTPSHLDENTISQASPLTMIDNSCFYNRGNLIHKLLQFLPTQNSATRKENARTYLAHQGTDFSPDEQEKILQEVFTLIDSPQFAPLFSDNSLAEVPIMGQVDDRIISGKIDRLVVLPDQVMIIDYKTNRPAARMLSEVPEAYTKQLHAYKRLIAEVYPNKTIKTYILWTNTTQIMEIA